MKFLIWSLVLAIIGIVLTNREESLFSFIDDAYHAGGALQCFSEPQGLKHGD